MPATVTLNTTTLTLPVGPNDRQVNVASTVGLNPDTRLCIAGPDREVMDVVSVGAGNWVDVRRGVDGTTASAHASATTVYIARADQLYDYDPVGMPGVAVPVSPWINIRTGAVWFAQGDIQPEGQTVRWWQQQTTTYDVGALGVRTVVLTPTEST